MITRINEPQTLTKYFFANVNVNLMVQNVIQIKSGITSCVDVRAKIQENIMCVEKIMFGILAFCKIDKYLNITDDSVVRYDKIIEVTIAIPAKLFQQFLTQKGIL